MKLMDSKYLNDKICLFQFAIPFQNEDLGSPALQIDFFPELIHYNDHLQAITKKRYTVKDTIS